MGEVPQEVDVDFRIRPDPNNCNVYYYLKVPLTCGEGNAFNKASLRCDSLENVAKVDPSCAEEGGGGAGGQGRSGGSSGGGRSGGSSGGGRSGGSSGGGGSGGFSGGRSGGSSGGRSGGSSVGGRSGGESEGLQTGAWEELRVSEGWKIFPNLLPK